MRNLFAALRLGVVVAILAAIVGQMTVSLNYWRERDVQNIASNVTNFFSFFTIEANVLSAAVLTIGAVFLLRGRTADPTWFQVSRACVVTYMVTTGVVYNLLLRGIELPQGSTLGWSNEILHVVAPIYLLVDWLFAPGRGRLEFRAVWVVIVFPIVWVIYTLIRGPFVIDEVFGNNFWYPYPFLNPNAAPTGYFSVAFYVVLISVLIAAAGFFIVWVSRRRGSVAGATGAASA